MKQCNALESSAQKLSAARVRALGVSMDPIPAQLAFAKKYGLTFPLLCDVDGSLCDAFEVPHPNNRPARYSYLFHNQKLIWVDHQVNPSKHIEHALQAVARHRAGQSHP
ncbi:redoxin domain-containing protein [Roseibacillus ishigakijimensis]|uniref:Redoxin domain-containing protein n=1 Tax=Roseibacillus ishigakijimensis TaxID=454146 RepID=A0A934RSJ0_9BACT|nr:redoxin domain-containing protein [Roseibacillus ishigakijimensis]MBK1834643.1 redoxin domain-containing protein [Roseibacillus ishigakijimensis]